MKTDVLQAALQILIPKEILDAFDLEKIEEVEGNTRIFHMVEKESQVPQVSEPLMKDGYMRGKSGLTMSWLPRNLRYQPLPTL